MPIPRLRFIQPDKAKMYVQWIVCLSNQGQELTGEYHVGWWKVYLIGCKSIWLFAHWRHRYPNQIPVEHCQTKMCNVPFWCNLTTSDCGLNALLRGTSGGQYAWTMPPALCSCPCWQRMPLCPASHQYCQIKSVTISWKLFNNPKPSVRETKARPQHGLAQNVAIHREGETRALAKPFMDREKDL